MLAGDYLLNRTVVSRTSFLGKMESCREEGTRDLGLSRVSVGCGWSPRVSTNTCRSRPRWNPWPTNSVSEQRSRCSTGSGERKQAPARVRRDERNGSGDVQAPGRESGTQACQRDPEVGIAFFAAELGRNNKRSSTKSTETSTVKYGVEPICGVHSETVSELSVQVLEGP